MKMFGFGSIRKNMSFLLLVTILPALIILLYSGVEQRRRSIEDATNDVFLLTHTMAGVQQGITQSVRQTLSTLSLLSEVQGLDSEASQKIFKAILKRNPQLVNLTLTDLRGDILASGKGIKKNRNLADCKHVKETLASKAFATGEFVYTRAGKPVPAFTYAYPVLAEDDSLIAVLATAVQLSHLNIFYDDLNLGEKSFISVTDHQGVRLFYYPPAEETNPLGSKIKTVSFEKSQKIQGNGQFTSTGSDGTRRIFAFENVRLSVDGPSYMTVWAGIPESSVLAGANTVLGRNLFFFFLSLFCSIVLFWLVGKKTLIEPITSLIALTKEYGAGNFDACCIQDTGPSEFVHLTQAFHSMAATLSTNQQYLQENEDRFRGIFNSMSSAVAIYEAVENGEGFIFKDINPAGARSAQQSRDRVIGKRVREVFPAVADIGLFAVFQRVWRTGIAEQHPASHYSDNRVELWVENHVFKLSSGEIVAVYDDITEQKQLERSLQQSKEEWESTFDAMGDIITIQDKEMRILRANKAFHKAFDVKYGALNGRHCYEVFRGHSQPCPNCPQLSTSSDKSIHSGEIFHKTLEKTFQVSSYPIYDEKGGFQHIVHIARDITEQKRIQEDLFQSHKMEAIGTLAGGIAHDFNNILSAILGSAQFVKKELPENSPAMQDIDTLIKSGKRAADLIKQILTFSRKKEHHLQHLTPYPIVREALQMLRSSLPSTIEIQEEIDRECGNVVADPTGIHQIIINLCTNALHAMDQQKGRITVKLYREDLEPQDVDTYPEVSAGPFIVLFVSDTGHGMDEETMQKVFEPYFTTKEVGKGSGIGLAVLHGIVQDYKGFIKVESTAGKGSTFRVYIPLVDGATITTGDDQQPARMPVTGGSGRILVVDDEELLIRINKRRLESEGYTVTAVTDSVEALEIFRPHPEQFDMLITDQTMPELSGAELTAEVLKIRPDLPVIMSTGHSDIVSKETALEMGITKYVRKPIQGNELIDAVHELLGKVIS